MKTVIRSTAIIAIAFAITGCSYLEKNLVSDKPATPTTHSVTVEKDGSIVIQNTNNPLDGLFEADAKKYTDFVKIQQAKATVLAHKPLSDYVPPIAQVK